MNTSFFMELMIATLLNESSSLIVNKEYDK